MRVPAADIGEGNFETDVGFNQTRDLPQAVSKSAARIFRTIGRRITLLLDGLHELDGVESLPARSMQHGVERGFIHAFEPAGAVRIGDLKVAEVIDCDGVIAAANRAG